MQGLVSCGMQYFEKSCVIIKRTDMLLSNAESMRIPKIFIGLIVTAFMLSSCESEDLYLETYTQTFMKFDSFRATLSYDGRTLELSPRGMVGYYSFDDKGEELKEFKRLCEFYGDTHYNRVVNVTHNKLSVMYPDLVSMDVICARDYDERHPAGSSLKDVVRLKFRSAFAYVSSGYSGSEPIGNSVLLKDVKPEQLRMCMAMNSWGEFYDVLFPKAISSGDVELEMTFADGRTLRFGVTLTGQ